MVPSYLANFPVPAVYGTAERWVKGFTVTQAIIDANSGRPLVAPDVGSFNAAGAFTPTTLGVGAYVPGIGTAPRPYRVTTDVAVPVLLNPRKNTTNAYADGGYPSGHTNSGYLQTLGVGFLVPQRMQELLTRASEIGYRIVMAAASTPALQPTYLEPFVGGAYVSIGRDRFAETGGLAALSGAAQTTEVATSTV
ncbi:autotransporter domain-containing protein, partial [Methylobacterium sp. Leaf113]|uniref:autotransporter domain-containing protein n=1 Tax=Methylobacterium sp. Leaf113 TaxID=1736259 RepID=UPI000B006BD0